MNTEHERAMAQLACDWFNSDPRGCLDDVVRYGRTQAVSNWCEVIQGHPDFGALWSPEGVLALNEMAARVDTSSATLGYAWVAHLPGDHKDDIEDSARYIMQRYEDALDAFEDARETFNAERASLLNLANTLDKAIAASWSPEEIAAAKDKMRAEVEGGE